MASLSGWQVAIVALALLVVVGAALDVLKTAARATSAQTGLDGQNVPDVPPPNVGDPVGDAELRVLQTVARQKGMSLEAAFDRYAWNDNFALAVVSVRKAFPEAFAGAEIVDAHNAWIAFKGPAPEAARAMIDAFTSSHPRVAVGVRTGMNFSEVELQRGIPAVHYAVLQRPEVRDATTGFDFARRKITTTIVLEDGVPKSVLNDLRAVAKQSLINATREDILDSIRVSVVLSPNSAISFVESIIEYLW